jgi:hypothetical protein
MQRQPINHVDVIFLVHLYPFFHAGYRHGQ